MVSLIWPANFETDKEGRGRDGAGHRLLDEVWQVLAVVAWRLRRVGLQDPGLEIWDGGFGYVSSLST